MGALLCARCLGCSVDDGRAQGGSTSHARTHFCVHGPPEEGGERREVRESVE